MASRGGVDNSPTQERLLLDSQKAFGLQVARGARTCQPGAFGARESRGEIQDVFRSIADWRGKPIPQGSEAGIGTSTGLRIV